MIRHIITILFILTILIFTGCNNYSPSTPKLSRADSLKKVRRDSLLKIHRDSVLKVQKEREAYLNRPWKTSKYVDDFGDPSTEKYIYTTTEGLFSNSATTNEYLYVKIIVDSDAIGVFLHEYQISRQAEKFIGDARIMLRNEADQTLNITTSSEWNNQGGIKISNSRYSDYFKDYSKMKSFLIKSVGKIRVVIQNEYSSIYRFTIDATGFTKEYKQI